MLSRGPGGQGELGALAVGFGGAGLLPTRNAFWHLACRKAGSRLTPILKDLPLKHLDEQLAPGRNLPYLRPQAGWLRAIREALGMTVRQFAKAAGAAPSSAQAAERAEARGDISLSTLSRYAEALGCEVRYVLVPT